MKPAPLFLSIAFALVVPASGHAADIDPATVQLWDVIYTADGSVLKGVIVEEVPNVSLRILIPGGTSVVVQIANVQRSTKELNPGYRAVPVGAVVASAPTPLREATSGLRAAVAPGLAYHTEADASSFYLAARAGYEIGLGAWGLTPSGFLELCPDIGYNDEDGVAITGGARAAYRASSVSPFVAFGIGADIVGSDVTLATSMAAGLDLLVHRRVALTAEGRYNRGSTSNSYINTMSYLAFSMGVELKL